LHQENAPQFRAVAAGEVVYPEGYAGNACIYVIAEGKVEILLKKNGKLQAEPFEPVTEKAPARR